MSRGFSLLEETFAKPDLTSVSTAIPEQYMAFLQGLDLVGSLDHESDYVTEWRAKWVPFFAEREHGNCPPLLIAVIQNDIAVACQGHHALPDAIDLYRRALINLDAHHDANCTASGSFSTPHPHVNSIEASDIKSNLAAALRMLGEERSCARLLREAIGLFDEVLAAQDPALGRMDRARAQSGKARAYKELYHVERDVELLRLALSTYDDAVRTLPPEMDSPWHQQVPGKREAVRKLLDDEIGSS